MTQILNIVDNDLKPSVYRGFPGGPVVKNPHCSTRDIGSIPGLGRFHMPLSKEARAPQLLSPCDETTVHLEPVLPWEATTINPHTTRKTNPCSLQWEKDPVQQQRLTTVNKQISKRYKKNHDPFKKLKIKEAVYNFKSSQTCKIVF